MFGKILLSKKFPSVADQIKIQISNFISTNPFSSQLNYIFDTALLSTVLEKKPQIFGGSMKWRNWNVIWFGFYGIKWKKKTIKPGSL